MTLVKDMPQKLSTIVAHSEKLPPGQVECVLGFRDWKVDRDSSDRNIKNYLLVLNLFARHLNGKPFDKVTRKDIIEFLDTRKKTLQDDPEEKWKATWNSYCNRIAGFYFWFVNRDMDTDPDEWEMPPIVSTIKRKKPKHLSPYSPNDVWEGHELLCMVKYCENLRDKLAIILMWDLACRSCDIAKLRIKHITFKEKYVTIDDAWGSKSKFNTRPAIFSLPYLRPYIDTHPFRAYPDAFLIISEHTDRPICPDYMHQIMTKSKNHITNLMQQNKIADADVETIRELLCKPWNPYLVGRHSSLKDKTSKLLPSQFLSFAGLDANTKRRKIYLQD